MATRPRALLWTLGLVLMLIWVGVLVVLQARRADTRLLLAGGIELRVLGTTYGTRHERPGLRKLLPTPIRRVVDRVLPGPNGPYEHRTSASSLVVWWTYQGPPGAVRPDVRLALADDEGRFAGETDGPSLSGGPETIRLFDSTVFPRRHPRLQLLVFEFGNDGHYHPVGTLPVRNPLAGDYPAWHPEPLPAAQTNGSLVCRLLAVRTGFGISSTSRAGPEGTVRTTYSRAEDDAQQRAALTLRFEDREWPDNRWEISSVAVADATGNTVVNNSLGGSVMEDADYECVFGPTLWPSEPWKILLAAVRRPESRFAPDEQLTLPDLPVPDVGATNLVQQTFAFGDAAFSVTRVIRRAPVHPDAGWSRHDLSWVELEASGVPEETRVTLVRAVDAQGRERQTVSSSYGSGARGHRELAYGFQDLGEDPVALTLTLAIQQPRHFTFVVQPVPGGPDDFQ